ncbi:MAG: hypothetical protein M3Q03_07135 [Chloroflexota bacterium]|nr:hypothetical protein [Chloroflexota bacterium]
MLDGQILTREELAEEVARLTGVAHLSEKMLHGFWALLKPAARRGDLCVARSVGEHLGFVRPDQWLGR